MKFKSTWWIFGILMIFSLIYMLRVESTSEREQQNDHLDLPKAPKKNRSIHVSPSKSEDPNSQDERNTIKPLS
jgi:hypothetical protein